MICCCGRHDETSFPSGVIAIKHTHTHTGGFLMKTCLILFLETVVKGKTTLTLGGGGFFKRRAAAKRRRRLTKGMRANGENGKEGGEVGEGITKKNVAFIARRVAAPRPDLKTEKARKTKTR